MTKMILIKKATQLLEEAGFSSHDYTISLQGPTVIFAKSGGEKLQKDLCLKADLMHIGIKLMYSLDYSKITNVKVAGIDYNDYPDFCDAYIESAMYGEREMTEQELEVLSNDSAFVNEAVFAQINFCSSLARDHDF